MKKIAAVLLLLLLTAYAVYVASKTPRRFRRSVECACWLYGIASVGLWLVLRAAGDRWWPATVFLFGPRWVWILPWIPLAVGASLVRRQTLWILLPTAWVVLFPVMGLCAPWRLAIPRVGGGPCLRVVSCNLHGQNADTFAAWLATLTPPPDVVAVQEWPPQRGAATLLGHDWHYSRCDELLLASRYPIRQPQNWVLQLPKPGTAACCELETPCGSVPFITLRLASPHQQLESVRWRDPGAIDDIRSNSELRLKQSRIVSVYAANLGPKALLAGDFNTPEGSTIFRQCWSRFSSAFSVAGWGFGHTYCARRVSTRIDNILAAGAWRCRRCWVGPNIGSPHRPLVADLESMRQDR